MASKKKREQKTGFLSISELALCGWTISAK
jgi:hypothetical protein